MYPAVKRTGRARYEQKTIHRGAGVHSQRKPKCREGQQFQRIFYGGFQAKSAGKNGKEIIAHLQYSGTMDSVLFEYCFANILLKRVQRGSVIVMDNASFHRKTKLPQLAEDCGCRVFYRLIRQSLEPVLIAV